MNSAVTVAVPATEARGAATRLAEIALARLAAGGAAEAGLVRDLQALLPATGHDGGWRPQLDRLIAALQATGHVERRGEKLVATVAGQTAVVELLGNRRPLPQDWPEMRDGPLVLLGLGLAGAPATRTKAAAKLDGLRALIVEGHFKLKLKGKPSAAKLRHALAMLALERAFGNQVKTELGEKSSMSARASRLLAARLAAKPRDFGTDARLVAALAAEAVGVKRSDLSSLRTGVLKTYLRDVAALGGADTERVAAAGGSATAPAPHPAVGTAPAAAAPITPSAQAGTTGRPDLPGFARAVKAAAIICAEGWAGNRRAFVSRVWTLIQERHAAWALSEIEFKAMLTEAHRHGLIALANADLKDKRHLKEVQESAVTWKNTVWHYVRADEHA